ncbi:MAG: J domain-containing protein [Lachnospiraceae bacterium]|nr:J domain-containing protein [Lachnospiraceae bacterium]
MAYFNLNEAYRILGIEPGSDIKEVKKAYASLIKQYHPEEHPEEWKKIHDAYTLVCDHLNNPQKPIINSNVIVIDDIKSSPKQEEPEFSEDADEKSNPIENIDEELKSFNVPQDKLKPLKEIDEEELLLDSLLYEAKKENGEASFGTGDDPSKDLVYFSDIFELINKLQDPDIVVYGKPVIAIERFLELHNHEKYDHAMLFPEFVSRLTEVLRKSYLDPDIRSYLEGDVIKAERLYIDREGKPAYSKLLQTAEALNSKSVFMANVAMERSKLDGSWKKASRRSERMTAVRMAWVILVIIFSVIGFIARIFHKPHSSTPTTSAVLSNMPAPEIPKPFEIAMLASQNEIDYEQVLADYDVFLEECKEFFEKYDIEDNSDPEVSVKYKELSDKRTEFLVYESVLASDGSDNGDSAINTEMKRYRKEVEAVWEDWETEDSANLP